MRLRVRKRVRNRLIDGRGGTEFVVQDLKGVWPEVRMRPGRFREFLDEANDAWDKYEERREVQHREK